MLFAGRLLSGAEAAGCRLVNAAYDANDIFPQAMKLAEEIANAAPIAVRMMKRTLYRGLGWEIRRAAYEEAYAQAITVETEDMREGINALLEKRPPQFKGR
jgi:enoyl-CoA hydratase/carnithine racemase